MLESWFPRNHVLNERVTLERVVFAGAGWQIYHGSGNYLILMTQIPLVENWCASGYIAATEFHDCSFANHDYRYLSSAAGMRLAPVNTNDDLTTYQDAKAFVTALAASRQINPEISLSEGIYVEQYSVILPTVNDIRKETDDLLLGRWLSRGADVPASSVARMCQLLPAISQNGLRDILQTANIMPSESAPSNAPHDTPSPHDGDANRKPAFALPGRFELESFINEHIIDIVENPAEYQPLGIGFPSPFILQGPPGCGKTFAIEKLIQYLGWPSFFVDSTSIGSPYIHETSKKIAALFNEAIRQAPSVLVIDEMESFLMDRASSGTGNGHHVEEIAEFLRLIPEAAQKHVLVVAMTNMVSKIDPAIRRRGRFDYIIEVSMPSREEISAVVRNGLDKVPHEDGIDVEAIGKALKGHPISDVSFVLREAARLSAKAHKKALTMEALTQALATIPTTPLDYGRRRYPARCASFRRRNK